MTIAFDPGAHTLRSLRRCKDRLVGRRCRSIWSSIPDNLSRRNWLAQAKIPHLVAEGHLILAGDAAFEAADSCDAVPRDLFADGDVPPSDPVTRQAIASLVEGLIPWSQHPREICCFVQSERPTAPGGVASHGARLSDFFTPLIRLRGYEPLPLHAGTALVLAELARSGFTGIGAALGASGCEISVVHRGNELAHGRLARGGRWIDEQFARRAKIWRRDALEELILDLEAARVRKEAVSLEVPSGDDGRLIAALYKSLAAELAEVLCETLASDSRLALLPQPLEIICGGGLAQTAGFVDCLADQLDSQHFPVALAGVQLADEPEYAVARGCLIRAELEQTSAPVRRRA
ncbi:MAG TPA: hypothetical protein VKU82_00930 [Planctomycetaceae bacterium]|nr:hypothetical protein [Planctomycetaceae bacterium]